MNSTIQSALRTIATERDGMQALAQAFEGSLGKAFEKAIERIAAIKGRLVVTGVGKSGHIGSKIAATMASTGTASFFVHSAEANHGDLGMITNHDAILAMSWSGETTELKGIVAYSRRFLIPLIAMTSKENSTLAKEADIALILPREEEACPHGLAPTTSTVMQLVTGDALAIALLESRSFSASDFKTFHPGGQLGASLTHIEDLMHKGDRMPLVPTGTSMQVAVGEISEKAKGCVGVIDDDGTLVGIVTDGDLRRNFDRNMLDMLVDQVMTTSPKTASPKMLASTAIGILNETKVTSLFVVEANKPVGFIHLHDLLRAGVA